MVCIYIYKFNTIQRTATTCDMAGSNGFIMIYIHPCHIPSPRCLKSACFLEAHGVLEGCTSMILLTINDVFEAKNDVCLVLKGRAKNIELLVDEFNPFHTCWLNWIISQKDRGLKK